MRILSERWRNFWFEPTAVGNLGFCRFLFFGTFFIFFLGHDFSGWASVSMTFWRPIWLYDKLHMSVPSAGSLILIQNLWKIALALSCVGFLTRFSTSVAFILGTYLLSLPHNFGVQHYDTLIVFISGIMAFSKCGDSWSVDQLIKIVRNPGALRERHLEPSGEYRWPVRVVWLCMALIFFAAGVSKIRHGGIEWITSENMAIVLVQHNYHIANTDPWVSSGLNIAQYGWLVRVIAAMTMLVEFCYPLALISTKARCFLVPGAFVMQVGIRALMGPSFEQYLICNLFWVPWDVVGRHLRLWFEREEKYLVLFDGGCGLCKKTVALIKRLDLVQRIRFMDALRDWPEIHERFPDLNQNSCLTEMHVIAPSGRTATGFDGYRLLAWIVPFGWMLLPILYLPGVPAVGRRVYASIASRRTCQLQRAS